jgi:hypothetical protein
MNDFQSRADARPWMLQNLVVALESVGLGGKALEVARHGLALPPDGSAAPLRMWSTYEQSLNGDIEQAGLSLRQLDRASLTPYYQFLHDLVEARLLLATTRPHDKDGMKTVHDLVRQSERTWPAFRQQPELRRAHRALMRRVVGHCGVRTPFWCWRRLLGPTVTVIFLILLGVGIALGKRWLDLRK